MEIMERKRAADTAKPTITAPEPEPDSTTAFRTVVIRATVKKSLANRDEAHIKLFLDGSPKEFAHKRATDRLTFVAGGLSLGSHTVRVVATDASGNTSVRAWSFRVVRR